MALYYKGCDLCEIVVFINFYEMPRIIKICQKLMEEKMKKRNVFFIGILAMALVIWGSMTIGCESGGASGGSGSGGGGGGSGGGGYNTEYVFEETSGRLTITNIHSKYEGKYVLAQ